MDKKTAIKISNGLNLCFNLIECDKDGYKFKELKDLIWKARNLSSWMLKYNSEIKDWNVVSKDEFKQIYEDDFKNE